MWLSSIIIPDGARVYAIQKESDGTFLPDELNRKEYKGPEYVHIQRADPYSKSSNQYYIYKYIYF